MTMEPLPAPGIAAFPQYLSNTTSPQSFIMKGESFSSSWTVTDGAGNPFLTVDAEKMSASHRKHLIDAASGQEICEIRKEAFSGHSRYNGVAPDGTTLFQTESHFHFSGNETWLKFINNAAGGQQDNMEHKDQKFSSTGEVTYKGKTVASITKKKASMRGQYDLTVAPGCDPFLIVALTVALDDKARSNARAGAAGGAAAGAGGGGG